MRLVAAVLLVSAAGCAPSWPGDPELYGFDLEIDLTQHNAPWVLANDLKPRTRRVIELGAGFWDVAPDAVSGWRLLLTEGLMRCGSSATSTGCTTTGDQTVAITVNFSVCIESSALVHEIGHVALGGDPQHQDRRWQDDAALGALWAELHRALPDAPDCGGEAYRGQWSGR